MGLTKFIDNHIDEEVVNIDDSFLDILNNLHEVITYKTLDHRILWANKTTLEEFNLSMNQIKGEYCYELFHNRNRPCRNCSAIYSANTGEISEKPSKTPDGRSFLIKSYPVKNDQNKVIGVIEIALNTTQQHILQEKLKYNELKNDFFANLSHEFKTPLNLIFSGLQMLDFKAENNGHANIYSKYTQTIKQNSYRLLRLINNLVDITKVDSNAYELNMQNYDIVSLIKNITSSVKEYAQNQLKHLYFNSEIEKKVIACDPFNIERVILNLISNAIKFTDEGDEIIVNIYDKMDKILISVKDTGIGIKEIKQKIIFERFGQADKTLTRNSEGSGIGLSLVNAIVKMHDGEIKLKSEYEKGSEFIIELPVRLLSTEKVKQEKKKIRHNIIDKIDVEFSDIYF
ncbi:sensor histidine kinase [Selenihalanaerobacter shriftii]|uniref:histidine kinase n=1 Tax=Selenihalanaerobacter shriftii TaxID=142842 RepID=A0A1T4NWL1_9FIRM|nr:PAS domain-containing sensor histidine kinase [Selenihalanaerobacter shriftii]SJZ83168.1 Signal transduction histidine kinase [Selenihalanaerobacter shriftii]